MSIEKEDLYRLVDRLAEQDKKSAYDFLRYLIDRHKNPYYHIDQLEPDDVPFNQEEQEQFDSEDEKTVSLEDLKRELKL
ncbi:hypothetical protein JQC72_08890 [Polycladomyces sp. WAk]|uniref:Uncharacterized protein n=1 Tax=Polycladomyces zharkentensis TaxID=2807616 RepID=A0ABS2WJD6_9BACL|nr:hypothetical protein [Polycladomyces sp. WAk]MBN2909642.1 hypothetical protein [Polycladomyces sp. WAk]